LDAAVYDVVVASALRVLSGRPVVVVVVLLMLLLLLLRLFRVGLAPLGGFVVHLGILGSRDILVDIEGSLPLASECRGHGLSSICRVPGHRNLPDAGGAATAAP